MISNETSEHYTPLNKYYSPIFRLFNPNSGFHYEPIELAALFKKFNITFFNYDGTILEPEDVEVRLNLGAKYLWTPIVPVIKNRD